MPLVVQVQPTAKTDQETAKEQAKENRETSAYRWTIGLGILTGFLSLLQLVAIGFQARISKKQNSIIDTQSTIMRGQREAADRQSEYMREGLDEARRASETANIASIAAREQVEIAKQSLIETLAIARTEQRAWVGLTGISRMVFDPGKRLKFGIKVKNTGRTPALNMRSWSTLQGYPAGEAFVFRPPIDLSGQSVTVLQPGDSFDLYTFSVDPLDTEVVDKIRDKKVVIHIYGRVEYRDVFGAPHFTEFHSISHGSRNECHPAADPEHNNCD